LDEFGLGVELSSSLASGEFGFDGEDDFHGPLEDLTDDGGNLFGEVVFDPATDEEVRHADFEVGVFDGQARGVFEPDAVALLADFLQDSGVYFFHQVWAHSVHGDSPGYMAYPFRVGTI